MAMTIGVSELIGVALGLRFNVLVLILTIIVAAVSTAVIQAARGDQTLSMVVAIFFGGNDASNWLFGWDYRTRSIRETCSARRK
jgi:hypothetical protein